MFRCSSRSSSSSVDRAVYSWYSTLNAPLQFTFQFSFVRLFLIFFLYLHRISLVFFSRLRHDKKIQKVSHVFQYYYRPTDSLNVTICLFLSGSQTTQRSTPITSGTAPLAPSSSIRSVFGNKDSGKI